MPPTPSFPDLFHMRTGNGPHKKKQEAFLLLRWCHTQQCCPTATVFVKQPGQSKNIGSRMGLGATLVPTFLAVHCHLPSLHSESARTGQNSHLFHSPVPSCVDPTILNSPTFSYINYFHEHWTKESKTRKGFCSQLLQHLMMLWASTDA